MSYVATGKALGAAAASLVDQAIAALPSCYGTQLDNCFNDRSKPTIANCDLLNAGYDADSEKMEAAIERLPFCDTEVCSPSMGIKDVAGMGVIGLLLGLVIGMKMK